jgi:glycosyl-4,4'-diaponeurosporenoate acyltransferase
MSMWIIVINVLAWPVIHLLVSKLALSRPLSSFDPLSPLYRIYSWEKSGALYERLFRIRRWKRALPDGARMLGGDFAKSGFPQRDLAYLERFLAETYRAEWAHWITMLPAPLFFLFNPLWAGGVMLGYAVLANLPCILTQRYNRAKMLVLLQKVSQ